MIKGPARSTYCQYPANRKPTSTREAIFYSLIPSALYRQRHKRSTQTPIIVRLMRLEEISGNRSAASDLSANHSRRASPELLSAFHEERVTRFSLERSDNKTDSPRECVLAEKEQLFLGVASKETEEFTGTSSHRLESWNVL